VLRFCRSPRGAGSGTRRGGGRPGLQTAHCRNWLAGPAKSKKGRAGSRGANWSGSERAHAHGPSTWRAKKCIPVTATTPGRLRDGSRFEARREHNLRNIDARLPLGGFRMRDGRFRFPGRARSFTASFFGACQEAKKVSRARSRQAIATGVEGQEQGGVASGDGGSVAAFAHAAVESRRLPGSVSMESGSCSRLTPDAPRPRTHREHLLVQLRYRALRAVHRQRLGKDRDAVVLSDVFVRCPECEGRRYQAPRARHSPGWQIDPRSPGK